MMLNRSGTCISCSQFSLESSGSQELQTRISTRYPNQRKHVQVKASVWHYGLMQQRMRDSLHVHNTPNAQQRFVYATIQASTDTQQLSRSMHRRLMFENQVTRVASSLWWQREHVELCSGTRLHHHPASNIAVQRDIKKHLEGSLVLDLHPRKSSSGRACSAESFGTWGCRFVDGSDGTWSYTLSGSARDEAAIKTRDLNEAAAKLIRGKQTQSFAAWPCMSKGRNATMTSDKVLCAYKPPITSATLQKQLKTWRFFIIQACMLSESHTLQH